MRIQTNAGYISCLYDLKNPEEFTYVWRTGLYVYGWIEKLIFCRTFCEVLSSLAMEPIRTDVRIPGFAHCSSSASSLDSMAQQTSIDK